MTTFPDSRRVLNGALVGIDTTNPVPSVIVFQRSTLSNLSF
jgi:hypothetical protein